MKLAHISHCYKPIIGGQEVYIDNLQKVLQGAGIQGDVFQPDRGVVDEDVMPVFRMRVIPRLVHGTESHLFDFFLNLKYGRKLESYDVVIAHYALHAWRQRKNSQKTIVLSHGVEWHQENQNWDDKKRERAARLCFDHFPHVVNDTHYLRCHGLDVSPGENFFKEVAPQKWFIPNCVDNRRFCSGAGHASLKNRKVILVPRQITPDRGIDLAIKAFSHVLDEDPELEMCILGKRRPSPYLSELDEIIAELDLEKKVYFEENVPNAEMPAWYNGAYLTVIPTLRREGTSLSALESMSCGTATVSTNVAGLADLPTVQCDPVPEDLAKAILSSIADRDSIAVQQQLNVHKIFNMENWAQAWIEVLRQVTGKSI